MGWEPWTGCQLISPGCANCYFYGPHAKRHGQTVITKTDKFDWPIKKNAKGEYCLKGNRVLPTCFATDFFLAEADQWRTEVWAMIKARPDIEFLILTKRIDRFMQALPADWGEGYPNVFLGCTVENQDVADYRLPLFLSYPIKRRFIACAPLLEPMDISAYLHGVEHVTVSGESARMARECNYDWVEALQQQCIKAHVTFWFKSTGSRFRMHDTLQTINPFKQTVIAKQLKLDVVNGKKLF